MAAGTLALVDLLLHPEVITPKYSLTQIREGVLTKERGPVPSGRILTDATRPHPRCRPYARGRSWTQSRRSRSVEQSHSLGASPIGD